MTNQNNSSIISILFLVAVGLSNCFHCLGQCTIRGHILDESNRPVMSVTVQAKSLSDTITRQNYSDANGYYEIKDVPSGSCQVKASAMFMTETTKKVYLLSGKTVDVDFQLSEQPILLGEVDVKSTGIIENGDTTKYVVNQFTTGQEQTLGDILENLPGIEINKESGSIVANGKNVNRVLIEKQDLFQGNNSLPVNNLPAKDVATIEVIENYSEYSILEGFKMTNETVININMNGKTRNKVSGQADLQAGIKEKANVKDFSLLLKKKMMVSTIVSANNTGQALLSSTDIIGINGGLSELLSSGEPQERLSAVFNESSSLLDDKDDAYHRTNGVLSLNTVMMPSSKTKILCNGIVGYDKFKTSRTTHYNYHTTPLQYDITTNAHNKAQNANCNIKAVYTPTTTFNLFYIGKVTYLEGDYRNNMLMTEAIRNYDNNRNLSFENSLIGIKDLGHQNTLNLRLDFSHLENREEYDFNAEGEFYKDFEYLDDAYLFNKGTQSNSYSADLFLLKRINNEYYARIGIQSSFTCDKLNSDIDQSISADIFQNHSRLEHYTQCIDLQLRKDLGKFQFMLRANLSFQKLNLKELINLNDRGRFVCAPTVNLKYEFTRLHSLQLLYKYGVNSYQVKQLYKGIMFENYKSIQTSHLDKLYNEVHSVGLVHSLMKPELGITANNSITLSKKENALTSNFLSNGVVTLTELTTSNGFKAFSASTGISKRIFRLPMTISLSANMNLTQNPYLLEGERINSQSHIYGGIVYAKTMKKKGFNAQISINYSDVTITGTNSDKRVQNTHFLGSCSYTFKKVFAEAKIRKWTMKMDNKEVSDNYLDLLVRWNVSNNISLSVVAKDLMKINGRSTERSAMNYYFDTYTRTENMPGHILLSATIKY